MTRVILESPYAGKGVKVENEVEQNTIYAQCCMADCLHRGEAPFASHLLYTQPHVLDDGIPEERKLGIEAGFAWRRVAEKTVVYIDHGISDEMHFGIRHSQENNIPVEFRALTGDFQSMAQAMNDIISFYAESKFTAANGLQGVHFVGSNPPKNTLTPRDMEIKADLEKEFSEKKDEVTFEPIPAFFNKKGKSKKSRKRKQL